MLLLCFAADISEGQDDHREARWRLSVRVGGGGRGAGRTGLEGIHPHRPRDVLEVLVAQIDEVRVNSAAHVVAGRARNQHSARFAEAFQPRRNVDPVAQNVVAFDQDVAEIDADAIDDAPVFRRPGVALVHEFLDSDRAFDGRHHGGKFEQQPIARRLDDAPPEVRHQRPRRVAMFPHRERRPRLVLAHQARIPDDVGGEDRREAAGRRHCSGTPALRMPSKTGWSPAR